MDGVTNNSQTRPSLAKALGGYLLWRGLLAAGATLAPAPAAADASPPPDAKSKAARLKAPDASKTDAQAESPHLDERLIAILKRTYEQFGVDRILAVAAGITFYGILALFPAIAAFLALYGLFADTGSIQSHVASLQGVLPSGALDIIGEQVKRISSKGGSTLGFAFFLGLGASLWSANAGMKALMDGLNIAYEKQEERGFFKLNAVSLAFTFAAILFLIVALGAVAVIPIALNYLGLGDFGAKLLGFGRWPALLLVVVVALAVLYRYGTSPRGGGWRWVTPGSFVAAILWLAASAGFSYYASNFGSYNETYGSLGAAIGFMTWIWISMIVVLMGGELNGQFEAVERQRAEAAGSKAS